MSVKKRTIKVNHINIKGFRHLKGEVKIDVDENGVPLDVFWRRRLKDAGLDGCIEAPAVDKTDTKQTKRGKK